MVQIREIPRSTLVAVSPDARKILARCSVEDDAITLPNESLDRPLKLEVHGALEALGGTWIKARKAHVFEDAHGTDLADRFYAMVETGDWERSHDATPIATPGWLVEQIINAADVEPTHRVLDPAAGQGALAFRLAALLGSKERIEVCEPLAVNRRTLEMSGFAVAAEDFLDLRAPATYDRIVMVPPFSGSLAASHVRHAITQLRPGGRLVAVMPSAILQRQDRLHREVRRELMRNGITTVLPEDSFGGAVRAVMVVYDRPDDPRHDPFPVKVTAVPGRPLGAPERAVSAPGTNGTASEAPSRFRRLGDAPRKFKRLKRRGEG